MESRDLISVSKATCFGHSLLTWDFEYRKEMAKYNFYNSTSVLSAIFPDKKQPKQVGKS